MINRFVTAVLRSKFMHAVNLLSMVTISSSLLPAAEPVHQWLFNEGSGVIVTDTGSDPCSGVFYDGTTAQAHGPKFITDLQFGPALEFDGNDWILTDSEGINGSLPRTVTAWVYLTADTYRHTIMQYGTGTPGQYFRLVIEDRRLRFEVSSGNALAVPVGTMSLNQWYHIAISIDDFNNDGAVKTNEVKFYLNGTEYPQTSAVVRNVNTVFTDSNSYLRLGGAAAADTSAVPREPLTGRLGKVRMYDYALSSQEIKDDMGIDIPDSKVVVDKWLFDENSGVQTADTAPDNTNTGIFMDGSVSSAVGPKWVNDAARGTVLDFDGDDWIMTDSKAVTGPGPRTIGLWFQLNSTISQQTLVQWGNANTGQYYRFMIEDMRFRLEVASGNALALNAGDLEVGKWYYAAVVADDFNNDGSIRTPEVKFYLNGIETPQTSGAGQVINTAFVNDSSYLHIGGAAELSGSGVPRNGFIGKIDDLQIYNYALDQDEILEAMAQYSAWQPIPTVNDTVKVSTDTLSWTGGIYSLMHRIYFGTDQRSVENASPESHTDVFVADIVSIPDENGNYLFSLADSGIILAELTDYYWRVDTYNGNYSNSPWQGDVWSFITAAFDCSPDDLSCTGNLSNLTFNWNNDLDIQEPLYDFVICSDSDLTSVVASVQGLSAVTWTADTSNMLYEKSYYCCVYAYDPAEPALRGQSNVLEIKFNSPGIVENFNSYQTIEQFNTQWIYQAQSLPAEPVTMSYDADGQSIYVCYNLNNTGDRALVSREFSEPVNMQLWGTDIFQFEYRGLPDNSPAVLGLTLTDKSGNAYSFTYSCSEEDIIQDKWSPKSSIRASLADFNRKGVDTTRIAEIGIYIENVTGQHSLGAVNIDNISLDIRRCQPKNTVNADSNSDCYTDVIDLESLCSYWLRSGYLVEASYFEPEAAYAYYSFDQVTGSLIFDCSGNNRNGYVVASPDTMPWSQTGVKNGCIYFDGTYYASFPADIFPTNASRFSMSFWVSQEGLASSYYYVKDSENNCHSLTLGNAFDDNWNHICITRNSDSGINIVYLNGVAVNLVLNVNGDYANNDNMYLGAGIGGENDRFCGYIDELAVYDRVLSHEDIVHLYAGAGAVIEQPLNMLNDVKYAKVDLDSFSDLASVWLEDTLE